MTAVAKKEGETKSCRSTEGGEGEGGDIGRRSTDGGGGSGGKDPTDAEAPMAAAAMEAVHRWQQRPTQQETTTTRQTKLIIHIPV